MNAKPVFDTPQDRHYSREHNLWVQRGDGGRARVGVDAFLLHSLGELAYLALFDPGMAVARGHSIGTLEAAKMTTSIAAPVSGIITAINEAALSDPQLINRSPYADGWLIELDPTDWGAESRHLVSGDEIAAWAEESSNRLAKDAESDG